MLLGMALTNERLGTPQARFKTHGWHGAGEHASVLKPWLARCFLCLGVNNVAMMSGHCWRANMQA